MPFFSYCSLIWPVILITWGVILLFEALFGISIPLFKIVFAFFLFYVGYNILSGSSCSIKKQFYCNKNWQKNTAIFGEKKFDFSQNSSQPEEKNLNIIFGSALLIINPEIPTRISSQTVFGSSDFPNRTTITNGSYVYTNSTQEPIVDISTQVIFGSLKVIEKQN